MARWLSFLLVLLLVGVLARSARAQAHQCTGPSCTKVTSMGQGDPHITAYFQDSEIDRPICYDLTGKDGEVYILYKLSTGMTVTAKLVASPRRNRRGETYFAKFTFITNGTEVEINPFGVVVRSVSTKQILVDRLWHHWVSHSNPTFYSDAAQNLSVVHWQRKVIQVTFGGAKFQVMKKLLRYGAKPKTDFFYLGIYLIEAGASVTYGGVIGEMVDSKAYYQLDDGRDAIVFGGRTIRVVDKRQVNYLDGSVVKCWMVPNIEDLLKEKLEFYRRV